MSKNAAAAVAGQSAPQEQQPWPAPDVRTKISELQKHASDAREQITKSAERTANVAASKAVIELSSSGSYEEVLARARAGERDAMAAWGKAKQNLREFLESEMRTGKARIAAAWQQIFPQLEATRRESEALAERVIKALDALYLPNNEIDNVVAEYDSMLAKWNAAIESSPELKSFRLPHNLRENAKQVFAQSGPALRFVAGMRAEFHRRRAHDELLRNATAANIANESHVIEQRETASLAARDRQAKRKL